MIIAIKYSPKPSRLRGVIFRKTYWTYWTNRDCGQIVVKPVFTKEKLELLRCERKIKVPKTEVFGTFMVEISGIEPLTS